MSQVESVADSLPFRRKVLAGRRLYHSSKA
jgi:hypothetical protein